MQKKASARSTGSVRTSSSTLAFYKVRIPSRLMVRGHDYGDEVMIWMDLSWWMRHFYLDLISTAYLNNNTISFSLFCPNFDCYYNLFQSLVYFMLERTDFHISSHISPAACSEVLRRLLCWAGSLLWTSCLWAGADWRVMEPVNLKKRGLLAMLNEREVRFSTRHFTHRIQSQENPCICTGGSPAHYSGGWSAEPAMKWTISEMYHPHKNVASHTCEVVLNLSVDM